MHAFTSWIPLLLACHPPSKETGLSPDTMAPLDTARDTAWRETGDTSGSTETGPGPDTGEPPPTGPVYVIGAGPAGLAVAAEVDAVVFEAQDHVGGDIPETPLLYFLVGVPEQEEVHFDDSVAQAASDWPALTGAEATSDTLAWLEALPTVRDRLVDLGFSFVIFQADPILHRKRYFSATGDSPWLPTALQDHLRPGSEVRLSTWVDRVVVEDHRVTGLEVGGQVLPAGHVVVATGGYGTRSDLLAPLLAGGEVWVPAVDGYGGNGFAIDQARSGAWGEGSMSSVGWFRDFVPLQDSDVTLVGIPGLASSWIWVDADGDRFVDEYQTWSMSLNTALAAHQPAWALVTRDTLLDRAPPDSVPDLEAAMAAGTSIVCAPTASDLALALALDGDGLARTLEHVEACRIGAQVDDLGRSGSTFPALEGDLCAFIPARTAGKTFGGVSVSADGQVLAADGRPIVGLWSVGEAAGMAMPGLGGQNGFDGSITAVLWSAWRVGAAIQASRGG